MLATKVHVWYVFSVCEVFRICKCIETENRLMVAEFEGEEMEHDCQWYQVAFWDNVNKWSIIR